MSGLNILVVGASIAGPSAAYWFAKAGAKVTVIQQFPALRTNGPNIDIRTAGVAMMRKIPGMEIAVKAKRAPIDGFSIVRDDGRPYIEFVPTGNPHQQSLVSEYEIYRGDLAKIFCDLTKDDKNVKYVFGEQVTSIQQNRGQDGPVTVEFMNGYPTSTFDLVVACDGATSRTRAVGFGTGPREGIIPTNYWAAYCGIDKDVLGGATIGRAHCGAKSRMLGAGPGQPGGNSVVFLCLNPKSDPGSALAFREALKQGEDALKQYVVRHYEGMGWKTNEILKGVLESKDFYGSEIVQVKLPSLSTGRFVVIGDAGFAAGFTGAGTILAMTGAYILAGEISEHGKDVEAGLKGFVKTMRPVIKEMHKEPPFMAMVIAPYTAWGLWIRNLMFTLIAWTGIIGILQKYLAPAFANTEEYKLPEYEWAK